MLRVLISLCCMLLAIATIVLLHSAEILEGCEVGEGTLGVAYTNAAIWLALYLFLCLPFLRTIAKMIYVNALPALVGFVSAFALLYTVMSIIEECESARDNLLLTSGSNAVLSLLLLISELSCPKQVSAASYEELES